MNMNCVRQENMTSSEYQVRTLNMLPKALGHSLQDNKFIATDGQVLNITNSHDEFIKNPKQFACLWKNNYFWHQDDKYYMALACVYFHREMPAGNSYEEFQINFSSGNMKKPSMTGVFLLGLVFSQIF
ncbi:hypothetical protein K7432_013677 [Basidiobolus ranarum]|uniref:Uncharacterized protein n=1 Tax=Basidiobolus ranarum TaxID=34480 RepID=A0ABR2VQH9_9FUNG